jgi:hypothetical protein
MEIESMIWSWAILFLFVSTLIVLLIIIQQSKLKLKEKEKAEAEEKEEDNNVRTKCFYCRQYAIRQFSSNGILYRYPMPIELEEDQIIMAHSVCRQCLICGMSRLKNIHTNEIYFVSARTMTHSFCMDSPENEEIIRFIPHDETTAVAAERCYLFFPRLDLTVSPLYLEDDHSYF